jgi:DMSO/TMAO reductase YedYZ molybdopterin-dependent catalytic subunit
MRPSAPLLALLAAVALALAAGPAAAATRGAEAGDAPAPKRAMLRGPQSAAPTHPAAAPAKAPPLPLSAPIQSLASRVPADAGQCRLACAQTYYFCLADAGPETCPDGWTRCLAGCSRASAAP